MKEKLLTTKNVVLMGMFGALAGVRCCLSSASVSGTKLLRTGCQRGTGADRNLCHGTGSRCDHGSRKNSGKAGIEADQYRICRRVCEPGDLLCPGHSGRSDL